MVAMACAAEVSGQPALRNVLVERALSRDPDNERARWLAGQVRDQEGWTSVASVEEARSSDAKLKEYTARREATADNASSRLALANWCRDQGMPDRERVHLREIAAWYPNADSSVLLRLGMRKYRGQWVSVEEAEELRQKSNRQRRARSRWRPVFADWKEDLNDDDMVAIETLAVRLEQVTDGDALPILEEMLSTHSEKAAAAVVAHLDTLRTQEATESLVRHAVFSEFEPVRAAACEALKRRSKYNYIPMLLAGLVAPVEVTVDYPTGNRNYVRRTVVQRGQDYDLVRVHHLMELEVRLTNASLGRGARGDARLRRRPLPRPASGTVFEQDSQKADRNQLIRETLVRLTGEYHQEPTEWWDWWRDYTEYDDSGEKPTYERHTSEYSWRVIPRQRSCCLAWKTPVATETGLRPIEQIVPGDKVLAQDPLTGQLNYKVVLERTIRHLGKMRKISLGGDSITVTLGHPFWVAGRGWLMAKEVEVGQRLCCLGESREITEVAELPEDVGYNLVVEDFATYFAGECRVLLHDNTLPLPTDALLPGFVPTRQ
jgi:hypothetical protein